MSALVVLSGAALIFLILTTKIGRTESVAGLILPEDGTIELTAPNSGSVTEIRIREGVTVAAGETIATISAETASANERIAADLIRSGLRERLSSTLAERRAKLKSYDFQKIKYADQEARLQEERESAEREVMHGYSRLEIAKRSLARIESLALQGFISDTQADLKREDVIELQMKVESTKRTVASISRAQEALKSEASAWQEQSAAELAQLTRSLSQLEQELNVNSALRSHAVESPRRGIIGAIHVSVGSKLTENQSIATLVPARNGESRFQAHLYVRSRSLGNILPGQTVLLKLEAFPYRTYGVLRGKVISTSQTPIGGSSLPTAQSSALFAAARTLEPLFRIVVEVDEAAYKKYAAGKDIRAGMTVEADIIYERRTVLEWIFKPLLNAKARILES